MNTDEKNQQEQKIVFLPSDDAFLRDVGIRLDEETQYCPTTLGETELGQFRQSKNFLCQVQRWYLIARRLEHNSMRLTRKQCADIAQIMLVYSPQNRPLQAENTIKAAFARYNNTLPYDQTVSFSEIEQLFAESYPEKYLFFIKQKNARNEN